MSSGDVMSRLTRDVSRMVTVCVFPFLVTTAFADELSQANTLEKKNISESVKSQQRINTSSDRSFTLKADIESLEAEVASLKIYRDHLDSLVLSQQQELSSLDDQLTQIDITKRSVVPLMYRMLDSLESSITNDKPIRPEARKVRLNDLKSMMSKANISDAEKYRRILEAYQIELDYGIKLGSFKGTISADGITREAEQLYIGRAVLVARSLDQQTFWSWNTQQKQWDELSSAMGSEINKAFAIAYKQASPNILTLPVSLKEGE